MMNGTKQTFEIIGFVREVGFQNQYLIADHKSFSHLPSIYKIKFDASSESHVNSCIVNLEDALRSSKLSFQKSVKVKAYIQSFKTNSINVLNFFVYGAQFMLIVSGIGLSSIMSIQIMDRTKEIGIIKSLGGNKSQIYKMIVMETGVIGIMSFLLTVCLSIPLGILLNNVLAVILFRVELFTTMTGSYFLTLAFYIAIIIGLASLAPAQIAVKTSVKEALTYE
jgi:ABC-type antimicrobial peptide transport system permease subunit